MAVRATTKRVLGSKGARHLDRQLSSAPSPVDVVDDDPVPEAAMTWGPSHIKRIPNFLPGPPGADWTKFAYTGPHHDGMPGVTGAHTRDASGMDGDIEYPGGGC